MRDELARQLSRRRTRLVLGVLPLIPLALALLYAVRGAPELASGASPRLVHLADGSALAFASFVLYLCAPLLLVAVAALFAGDALASEHAWGSMRYLLAAPVQRQRLLARKLLVAVLLAALATVLLVTTALVAGWLAFGWHALDTPVGGIIPAGAGALRLGLATAYVLVTLLPFVALALAFATATNSPLGAVGGSMAIAVMSQILDVVPTLGRARELLPTHFAYAWTDLFVDPPQPDDVASGTLQAVCWLLLGCAVAWWNFARRDVTG